MLTEDFRAFPQSFQANAEIVLGHDHFLSHPFKFIIILSQLLTQSSNKQYDIIIFSCMCVFV
jgi:hypothetical protein